MAAAWNTTLEGLKGSVIGKELRSIAAANRPNFNSVSVVIVDPQTPRKTHVVCKVYTTKPQLPPFMPTAACSNMLVLFFMFV